MITNNGFEIKIASKIEEIPRNDWEKVFPDAVENYYFFKTLDESKLSQFSFFYILIYDNGVPVGATSCFIMNFPMDLAVKGAFRKITGFIKLIFPGILSPRLLICGLPMGMGRIGIAAEPGKVIRTICSAMEQIAREEKIKIIAFKDFGAGYSGLLDKSLGKSFFRIKTLPNTVMEIKFSSFEEYLKTLSSASRSGLRRKFKEIDGRVKIDLEITNKLEADVLSRVYALYLQTFEKQEMGLEKLSADFFRNISENLPDETKFFLWRIDGKLAAFALCLVSGDYLVDYYLGFDYTIAYQNYLYFVRFRGIMNWCIENKIRKYEMGVTGYEPKRRLGFDFIPLYIYAKCRNKLFNPFFRILSYIMQPVNFHKEVMNNRGEYGG